MRLVPRSARLNVVGVERKGSKCNLKKFGVYGESYSGRVFSRYTGHWEQLPLNEVKAAAGKLRLH